MSYHTHVNDINRIYKESLTPEELRGNINDAQKLTAHPAPPKGTAQAQYVQMMKKKTAAYQSALAAHEKELKKIGEEQQTPGTVAPSTSSGSIRQDPREGQGMGGNYDEFGNPQEEVIDESELDNDPHIGVQYIIDQCIENLNYIGVNIPDDNFLQSRFQKLDEIHGVLDAMKDRIARQIHANGQKQLPVAGTPKIGK